MTANTMRARALPLVTPRVQRPHRYLKVSGDLGWRCQRRASVVALPASSPAPPGIVTTRVAPSSDAFAQPASATSRDPADTFSSSPTRRVNFSSTFRLGAPDPAGSAERKRPCDQGLRRWALRDSNPRPLPCKKWTGLFETAGHGPSLARALVSRCALVPTCLRTARCSRASVNFSSTRSPR
jgi:hypothetical protein